MKKCIGLIRVSTGIQSLDSQQDEVKRSILIDGYNEGNIYFLRDKESGVKLSEEERNGIKEMKQLIEHNPDIDCVYVYELSRLSRRPKDIYSIRDWLIERKVNLKIITPACSVLRPDGSFDDGSNIVFTLFAGLAENEGYIRKARLARGRAKKVAEGKSIGSAVPFGYYVDREDDNRIKINPEEAAIVKRLYELYSLGNTSTKKLTKEFAWLGKSSRFVQSVLSNLIYTGESGWKREGRLRTKQDVRLPQIVSIELFNKVQEMKRLAKSQPKKIYSSVYFGKGLIECPECGCNFITRKHTVAYSCPNCSKRNLSINCLDSLLWHLAKQRRSDKFSKDSGWVDKELKELKASKFALTLRYQSLESEGKVEKLNDQLSKAEIREIEGKISPKVLEAFRKKVGTEITQYQREIDQLNLDILEHQNRIIEIEQRPENDPLTLDSITEDETKRSIVLDEIKRVYYINKPEYYQTNIAIDYKDGSPRDFYLIDASPKKRIHKVTDSGKVLVDYEFVARFKRTDRTPEKAREYNKRYCAENKEKNRIRAREYRLKLKELKG